MAASTELREIVLNNLRSREPAILELGERLRARPETGFKESGTALILAEALHALGVEPEMGLAITGIRASVGPKDAPEIILLADMDALPTAGAHGGIAHSCGHHAQMTVMFAVFSALVESRAPDREGFRLTFLTAPAEEYVELDRKKELRAAGRIRYLSGKQELLWLGAFDRAVAVIKYHSMSDEPGRLAVVNGSLNGFMAKKAVFTGKSAHAGAHPERGINALNAATLALQAIHAQRETFKDDDHVRVHPIMTEGGTIVNTVPERAVLETFVRGSDHRAIHDAALKVDRALAAGAIAIGATVRIIDTPGYQAFRPSPELGAILGKAALELLPEKDMDFNDRSTASDDIGDVACLVPTCQLAWGGFSGTIHASDFLASDLRRAYLEPALALAAATFDAGRKGAELSLAAKAAFKPRFTKEAYFAALDAQFADRSISWVPPTA
ncbi:MAG: M20/M25/M40 family metallo-hydrolase [Spirochaetota bacterium]